MMKVEKVCKDDEDKGDWWKSYKPNPRNIIDNLKMGSLMIDAQSLNNRIDQFKLTDKMIFDNIYYLIQL